MGVKLPNYASINIDVKPVPLLGYIEMKSGDIIFIYNKTKDGTEVIDYDYDENAKVYTASKSKDSPPKWLVWGADSSGYVDNGQSISVKSSIQSKLFRDFSPQDFFQRVLNPLKSKPKEINPPLNETILPLRIDVLVAIDMNIPVKAAYARILNFTPIRLIIQQTGSFKARGACNATILALETGKYNGVCTHSSGNHAQALAMAAKSIGSLEAHIVMPLNSPQCKREGVIGYGANVYYCESTQEAREKMSKEISESTGSLFIHPSEDINVICGQGTVAIEFLSQVPDLDIIIVPVGGGGLISGIATAAKAIKPSIVIIGAEPEEANDAFRSKTSNQWIKNDKPPITIADGLKTSLGPNTWPIVNSLVDEVITVSEDEIKHALKLVWERMKCLIEPSAAVGVAVATNRKFLDKYTNPANVGIVLCGGNS
eukprot:gene17352-22899_t